MAGKTVTRAQLAESVYQEVGLSRSESAGLVDAILDEISQSLLQEGSVKISSFGTFAVRQKGHRVGPQPEDRRGSADPAAPGAGVPRLAGAQGAHQRRARTGRMSMSLLAGACRHAAPGELGRPRRRSPGRVPHHQRGRRRARRGPARAALLGEQVRAGPPAQARRRAALLPARGRRPAAPDPQPALRRGLHHQGRAEAAARAAHPPGPATSRRRPRRPRLPRPPAARAAPRAASPEVKRRLAALRRELVEIKELRGAGAPRARLTAGAEPSSSPAARSGSSQTTRA